jgi:TrmH family RNA methyltransferase
MQVPDLITSSKNERIKALQRLEKSSERRETGTFLIEGKREILKALKAGFELSEVYYCPSLIEEKQLEMLHKRRISLVPISHHVFESIAYRENKDGMIAVCRFKSLRLEELPLSPHPLLIVLEAVEKPGNLGAILRTADACGADAIIVCEPKTDIYNPNVIRASLGCVFSKSVVCCTKDEALDYLHAHKIQSIATTPYTDKIYFEEDLTQAIAIVMGTEADGLSEFWLKNTSTQVKVPMLGEADSLNVSVCTAILVYESLRQRQITSIK